MSQKTPKNKDAGRTNSQESPSNSSKKNNQSNPHEESKDPAQNQNQKKGWSFNSWFKKPKTSPGNDTTKDDSTQSTEEEIMKSKPKNLEKFGNYAKNLLKGIANNVQTSFMEPAALGDPMWGDFQSPSLPTTKPEETKNDDHDSDEEEYEEEDDEENQDDDEENEDEEGDEDEDEEDSEEEDEAKGYEEDEGSLDEEQDKQEAPKEPTHSDDNFAIDDDEPEPIQHSNPDSQGEISEEQKAAGVALEKAKAKKTKKGKGKKKSKKEKAKRKKRREPKPSEGVVLEDVFVNKRYVYGAPFTDFHQFYFKGDYLDFDPDEFFRVELVNEKGGLTNLIFNEKKYIAIQDQIFYFMKLEKIDTFDLGLVLESYPLSRLVRLDKVDKKKRIDLSFYTEDSIGNPNQQREFILEVKNYAKFVKVIDQHLTTINSSFHILRYNIE